MKSRTIFVSLTTLLGLMLLGCDRGGVKRYNLSGTVTFKGEPLPFGNIAFRPDRSKGGSGPAGFAKIQDGEYSTNGTGKGSVAGPVEVAIEGFESSKPLAPALFAPYKTTVEISGKSRDLNFDVPETAAPKWFQSGAGARRE